MLDEGEAVLVGHGLEYGLQGGRLEQLRQQVHLVSLSYQLKEVLEGVFVPKVAQVFPEVAEHVKLISLERHYEGEYVVYHLSVEETWYLK